MDPSHGHSGRIENHNQSRAMANEKSSHEPRPKATKGPINKPVKY